jgi:hypothetical protein
MTSSERRDILEVVTRLRTINSPPPHGVIADAIRKLDSMLKDNPLHEGTAHR